MLAPRRAAPDRPRPRLYCIPISKGQQGQHATCERATRRRVGSGKVSQVSFFSFDGVIIFGYHPPPDPLGSTRRR